MLGQASTRGVLPFVCALAVSGEIPCQELTIPVVASAEDADSSSCHPIADDSHARALFVYANWNFAGIDEVIRITRLRFRGDAGAVATGGTIASARIDLSSAAVPAQALVSSFDLNHGQDRRTCYVGPITVLPTSGNSPNDDCMAIALTTPFYFDPRSGADLAIDVLRAADYSGDANGRRHDAVDGGLSGRLVRGALLAAEGTVEDVVPVVTVEYETDIAFVRSIGRGCGQGRGSTFHELFHARWNPLDLGAGAGWTAYRTDASYVVLSGVNPIVPPTGVGLALADDDIESVSLPWPMSHPGGTTQQIWVSSNGFVAFEPTSDSGSSENLGQLLAGPARACPLWTSLDPTSGGSVHAEADPADPGMFHVTWLDVASYVNAVTTGGANTFQISFHASGSFEVKYGALSANDGLVGFTAGHGALPRDAVDIDVDTPGGWLPGYDNRDLELAPTAGARPLIGSTFSMTLTGIPPTATAAAMFFGFDSLANAADLAPVGMTGCGLSIGTVITTKPLAANGDAITATLSVPPNPALRGLCAVCQAAVAGMPNVLPLTVGTSNALELTLGNH